MIHRGCAELDERESSRANRDWIVRCQQPERVFVYCSLSDRKGEPSRDFRIHISIRRSTPRASRGDINSILGSHRLVLGDHAVSGDHRHVVNRLKTRERDVCRGRNPNARLPVQKISCRATGGSRSSDAASQRHLMNPRHVRQVDFSCAHSGDRAETIIDPCYHIEFHRHKRLGRKRDPSRTRRSGKRNRRGRDKWSDKNPDQCSGVADVEDLDEILARRQRTIAVGRLVSADCCVDQSRVFQRCAVKINRVDASSCGCSHGQSIRWRSIR